MSDYTIYNGDCFDVLKGMPDESVDLVITSPPYGELRTYGGNVPAFTLQKCSCIIWELYRIMKPGGVVVWIVCDQTINGSESGMSFEQALNFKQTGFNIHDTMIWAKNGVTFPFPNRYYQTFEYMFVFSKGRPKTIHLLADRINKYGGRKYHGTKREPDGSMRPIRNGASATVKDIGIRFNIWNISPVQSSLERTGHPAQFPLRLVRDHLVSWSEEGDVVMDPFMGSGTTGEACIQTGRKFIGVEINPDYFQIAEARIQKAVDNFQNMIDFSEDYAT